MVLDSKWAEFNCYKIAMAIPMLLAAALITYISYQFYWIFLPDYYKVSVSWWIGIILTVYYLLN